MVKVDWMNRGLFSQLANGIITLGTVNASNDKLIGFKDQGMFWISIFGSEYAVYVKIAIYPKKISGRWRFDVHTEKVCFFIFCLLFQ